MTKPALNNRVTWLLWFSDPASSEPAPLSRPQLVASNPAPAEGSEADTKTKPLEPGGE